MFCWNIGLGARPNYHRARLLGDMGAATNSASVYHPARLLADMDAATSAFSIIATYGVNKDICKGSRLDHHITLF